MYPQVYFYKPVLNLYPDKLIQQESYYTIRKPALQCGSKRGMTLVFLFSVLLLVPGYVSSLDEPKHDEARKVLFKHTGSCDTEVYFLFKLLFSVLHIRVSNNLILSAMQVQTNKLFLVILDK